MFITRESDYAVRALRELAGGELKTVQTICEREQIPFQYGYKILKKLEKTGLVQGFRGAGGGYRIAKLPETITLFDVVSSIDESLAIAECLKHGADCPRNRGLRKCKVHTELDRIQRQLLGSLKEKSLAELI
ncbi:MAG: Rrf2 family transcriptional regulator [Spirochaetaceae bacterium]|jgi:Rrf2 family protein|nr:Rrf2 family transcriptional regulator [Spirochaetaceae bacterium]